MISGREDRVDPIDENACIAINYTSGTTGRPKGAVHVHGGFTYQDALMLGYAFDLHPLTGCAGSPTWAG